jgi:hypothetical protein
MRKVHRGSHKLNYKDTGVLAALIGSFHVRLSSWRTSCISEVYLQYPYFHLRLPAGFVTSARSRKSLKNNLTLTWFVFGFRKEHVG